MLGEEEFLEANPETLAPEPPATPPQRPPSATAPPNRPHSAPSTNPLLMSSDPIGGGRFAPGTLIAERYRIVALLGRGGMGEVYRAEDLKLTQVVAIKFLPTSFSQDASVLARFHAEVRVARQVSHPNVCRVFDIGDAEGMPFLTMEYVDGEDLSSLVRRIGRLPEDKAAEVSRQICAGLAAAHDRGIVHRDLKPANVMLDGSGKVRITDFGLAGIAANIQGAEVRAGTPAYMAPEQLAGREVTMKSDIYSLGLVMYEILTGRRAFEANTLPELIKAREEGTLTNPSTLVKDLDPLTERLILRCLERDPAKRPSSALQVAAALPGGDPLAAALAAGETPSPEMVAAAGETEGLNPRLGSLYFVAVLAMLGLLVTVNQRAKLVSYLPFGDPPEVLASNAREMIKQFGYEKSPADTAWGFKLDNEYIRHIQETEKTPTRWNVLREENPPAMIFWYRQSHGPLLSYAPNDNLVFGRVQPDQPRFEMSDSRRVLLNLSGKLIAFDALPPQVDEPRTEAPVAPDWSVLFQAAGLDSGKFKPVAPSWYPLAWGDTRAAWDGAWPGHPESLLHVEAAGYRGKAIFFRLISPWDRPERMDFGQTPGGNRIPQLFSLSLLISILTFGVWLSVKNLRSGRGDLRGAVRLAILVLCIGLANWLLLAHHVSESREIVLLMLGTSASLLFASFTWLLYVALEPFVRKYWPDSIISWTRLLDGQWTDPVVGRDILLGTLFGVASAVLEHLQPIVEAGLGRAPIRPMGLATTYAVEGLRGTLASVLYHASQALPSTLILFFLFFPLKLLLKKNWLAALVMSLLLSIPSLAAQNPLIDAVFTAPFFLAYLYILYRFGLVALTFLYFIDLLADGMPIALPLNAWYTEGGLVAVVVIVAVAFYGFHVSRAGKPIFGEGELRV